MVHLSLLPDEDKRSFIHMIKNEQRRMIVPGQEADIQAINSACSNQFETELAKLSEKAKYEKKNHYLHQRRTLDYADKRRMPIDERKVKDLLRY